MADVGRQSVEAYVAAQKALCQDWINGHLTNIPPPPQEEGRVCLHLLDKYPSHCGTRELEIAYQELKEFHVVQHFDQAASHRRWLSLWYRLVNIADIDVDADLERCIEVHDLSKYSPHEALGYGIMFGETGKFKQLEGRRKELWDEALVNHYKNNQHHPQCTMGQSMLDVHLQESVLDMLACRTERTLASVTSVTPTQLVDIPDNFLERYFPDDRSKVKVILSQWLQKLEAIIEDRTGDADEVITHWEEQTGKRLILQGRCEICRGDNCRTVPGRTFPCSGNQATCHSSS